MIVPPPPVAQDDAEAMRSPRSAFHKRWQQGLDLLEEIAEGVGRAGGPSGDVIAFYMRAFNSSGLAYPATSSSEAAWLRIALNFNQTQAVPLTAISTRDPGVFRAAMSTNLPMRPSRLVARLNKSPDDLLAIHTAAAEVQAAIA